MSLGHTDQTSIHWRGVISHDKATSMSFSQKKKRKKKQQACQSTV